jgi:hypothetical protein
MTGNTVMKGTTVIMTGTAVTTGMEIPSGDMGLTIIGTDICREDISVLDTVIETGGIVVGKL